VDACNNAVAELDFDLSATEVVEFCKRELYGESMTDDGSDVSIEPLVPPEEWAELIADVTVNLMESKYYPRASLKSRGGQAAARRLSREIRMPASFTTQPLRRSDHPFRAT